MDVNDKKDLSSPCEFKGKTETATAWCTECDEPFCITCSENHNAHRSSRDHHVISVEGNKMLESLQIPLNEYCEVHDQEKDLYCSLHGEIICLLCTQTTHGECVPTARLSEVTKNTKTSTFVTMLASNVADVVDELRDILIDKENNKVEIEKQKKTEILDVVFINDQLNQVQNVIIKDLKAKCESSILEINKNIECFNNNLNEFEEMRKQMNTVKTYASDKQTVIGSKALEKTLHNKEGYLASFLRSIQRININIEANQGIFLTCADIKSFGILK